MRFTPAAMRAIGIANTGAVFKHVLVAALCFHSYQQVIGRLGDCGACQWSTELKILEVPCCRAVHDRHNSHLAKSICNGQLAAA